MMLRWLLIFLGLTALVIAPVGRIVAAERFYIGNGLSHLTIDEASDAIARPVVRPQDQLTLLPIDGSTIDDTKAFWFGRLGYQVWTYHAIEADYFDLDVFESSGLLRSPQSPQFGIEDWHFGSRGYPSASRYLALSRPLFHVDNPTYLLVPERVQRSRFLIPVGSFVPVPLATPDGDTILLWDFGLDFRLTDRVGVDIDYGQSNVDLSLSFSF